MENIKEEQIKLLFIGCGNMGFTIAESIAKANLKNIVEIAMHDISPKIEEQIRADDRFVFYKELKDIVPSVDYIFLGVKPDIKDIVFNTIKAFIRPGQVFVSLMAGIEINTIKEGLNTNKVIRTMPNLPAKVNKGVTTYVPSEVVDLKDIKFIQELLETSGIAIQVQNEEKINASTAISGSGSAYVFYFYKAMFEAAKDLGFKDDDATSLVLQTFEGALKLLKDNNFTPQDWIDRVSSKGGTTEAAIQSLVKNDVNPKIKEAIECAYDKANELGAKT